MVSAAAEEDAVRVAGVAVLVCCNVDKYSCWEYKSCSLLKSVGTITKLVCSTKRHILNLIRTFETHFLTLEI